MHASAPTNPPITTRVPYSASPSRPRGAPALFAGVQGLDALRGCWQTRGDREGARRLAPDHELYDAMPFGTVAPRAGAASAFIRGRLVCARNVNAELDVRGIRGTGSAWAKSFLAWGRRGSGQVGDVARKGGQKAHVAIVAGFDPNEERLYLNPSSKRQAWQIGPYHRQPIAFRSPS